MIIEYEKTISAQILNAVNEAEANNKKISRIHLSTDEYDRLRGEFAKWGNPHWTAPDRHGFIGRIYGVALYVQGDAK